MASNENTPTNNDMGDHDAKASDEAHGTAHVDATSTDDANVPRDDRNENEHDGEGPSDAAKQRPAATRGKNTEIKTRFSESTEHLSRMMEKCSETAMISCDESEVGDSVKLMLEHRDSLREILKVMKEVLPEEDYSPYEEDFKCLEAEIRAIKLQVSKRLEDIRSDRRSRSSRSSRTKSSGSSSKAGSVKSHIQKMRNAKEKAAVLKAGLAFKQKETELETELAEKMASLETQKVLLENKIKLERDALKTKKQIAAQEAIVKECKEVEKVENPFGLMEELEDLSREPSSYMEPPAVSRRDETTCIAVDEIPPARNPVEDTVDVRDRTQFSSRVVANDPRVADYSRGEPSINTIAGHIAQAPSAPPVTNRLNVYSDNFVPVFADNAQIPRDPVSRSGAAPNITASNLNVRGTLDGLQRNEEILLSMMREMISAQRLPSIRLWKFTGNPLDFPKWEASFEALVESRVQNTNEKMNLLRQYLGDGPLKVVDGYFLNNTEESYFAAKRELKLRYGGSTSIGSAFINELKAWKPVKSKHELREFSDFLLQVSANKERNTDLKTLDYASCQIPAVVNKLPLYLKNRWMDEVHKYKRATGNDDSYPPFVNIVRFIKDQSDIKNQPEFEVQDSGNIESKPKPKTTSFAFKVEKASCLHCEGDHHIADCTELQGKTMAERKKVFYALYLCFGCGNKTGKTHISRSCTKRAKCSKCDKRHPTCLHLDTDHEKEVSTSTSLCTQICDSNGRGISSALIIPVWVRSKHNARCEVLCYCVLDDHSNSSFISDELFDKLDLDGKDTAISLTTLAGRDINTPCKKVKDLEILSYDKKERVDVATLFTEKEIPVCRTQIPNRKVCKEWVHLTEVCDQLVPYDSKLDVSVLLGTDVPKALRPRDVVAGGDNEPYGVRTILGWGVVGPMCLDVAKDSVICHKTLIRPTALDDKLVFGSKCKEVLTPQSVGTMFEIEFAEHDGKHIPMSIEDRRFVEILKEGTFQRCDGHLEMPLPLKSSTATLPNNKPLAVKRIGQLRKRLLKDEKYSADYVTFMENVINNWAEVVPETDRNIENGKVNYIPHLGVYHPHKPDKIRVVFDCSAPYCSISLNDVLLSGPILLNEMLGVLCRFRKGHVALCTDIEAMFHQFIVSQSYRDFLRFLWFQDHDFRNGPLVEYRMKVHLFGAKSSPGCANFGLKRAADDGEGQFGPDAANFIRDDFYMDDGITSKDSVEEIVSLVKSSKALCASFKLRLCKFVSNSAEVMNSIPTEDRATGYREINLCDDIVPNTRTLGLIWDVKNDCFRFNIKLSDRAVNRRSILSFVNSVYDPLGFISPVVLEGKLILQSLCKAGTDWDDEVPDELKRRWVAWCSTLSSIEYLRIDRCFKPPSFGKIVLVEYHHFSDSSSYAYGQCSYVRLVNEGGNAHVSLVIGKARVAPLKRQVSIPRLELNAAVVSARMSKFLRNELKFETVKEYFWVDSMVVLGYIRNESKRFNVFVANRVQTIHDLTEPSSWHHISSAMNPSDDASRGIDGKDLTDDCRWLKGPEFLWKAGPFVAASDHDYKPTERDALEVNAEMRKATAFQVKTDAELSGLQFIDIKRLESISEWKRTVKAVANCLRYINILRKQPSTLSSELMIFSEKIIIRSLQREVFSQEISALEEHGAENRSAGKKPTGGSLASLNPFLDADGILRVGGRIGNSSQDFDVKHPIIMPRQSLLTRRLVRHFHEGVNHMGRYTTLNSVRQRGFWIVRGPSVVSEVIHNCVVCKKLRAKMQNQQMADLPPDRLKEEAPFTFSGCDVFGTYYIKERRSTMKRYCVVFTCMSSRAVHLEPLNTLTTDSFINALRRFICRRGVIKQLRCDCGTNFVGASNELERELKTMNQQRISEFLLSKNCDYFEFKFTIPHASHMSGYVERQIRTIKSALDPLLNNFGHMLCDESFRTFLCEVECIVNSRPLDVSSINDPSAPEPLTPNHILTLKSKIVLPPPGVFQKDDFYLRRRWRRVQYMANEFWNRWRKEYVQSLQRRKKWTRVVPNLKVGDVVLLSEENLPRNRWKLGRIDSVYPSDDGLVRKARILVGRRDSENGNGKPTYLERPIHKLILLVESASRSIKTEQ